MSVECVVTVIVEYVLCVLYVRRQAVAKIKVVLVVPSTTMNCTHYFFSVKIFNKKCLDHFFNRIQTLNAIIISPLLSCPQL